MEQSTSGKEEEELNYSEFTEKEIEVSQILLDLESIILNKSSSELRDCWPLNWGTKKRLIWGATKKRSPATLSLQKTSKNVSNAQSPSTPLAFLSSESDDKSKHCTHRNNSKKRSREELLKTVKELTENKIALQGELERVKIHYNGVLAYNRELKAAMKRQKESTKEEEPKMDINQSYNLGLSLGHGYQISLVPVAAHHQHQQQQPSSMVDPRARESFHRDYHGHQYPYAQVNNNPHLLSANNGLGRGIQVGPMNSSILDLNVSAAASEESYRVASFQPLDYSRAHDQRVRYAEARRERQVKMKMKIKQTRK